MVLSWLTVDFHERCVKARVGEEKAKLWRSTLEELVATNAHALGMASKCAGLLSFAVTVAADKCGRAYRRPFHAQALAPLHGLRVRASLAMAARCFIQNLAVLPTLTRRAIDERRVVRIWTDAASSRSWLAEVVECVLF